MPEDTRMITLNIEQFPESLRNRVKARAALRGMYLKDAVIEACRLWLDEDEAEKGVAIPNV